MHISVVKTCLLTSFVSSHCHSTMSGSHYPLLDWSTNLATRYPVQKPEGASLCDKLNSNSGHIVQGSSPHSRGLSLSCVISRHAPRPSGEPSQHYLPLLNSACPSVPLLMLICLREMHFRTYWNHFFFLLQANLIPQTLNPWLHAPVPLHTFISKVVSVHMLHKASERKEHIAVSSVIGWITALRETQALNPGTQGC